MAWTQFQWMKRFLLLWKLSSSYFEEKSIDLINLKSLDTSAHRFEMCGLNMKSVESEREKSLIFPHEWLDVHPPKSRHYFIFTLPHGFLKRRNNLFASRKKPKQKKCQEKAPDSMRLNWMDWIRSTFRAQMWTGHFHMIYYRWSTFNIFLTGLKTDGCESGKKKRICYFISHFRVLEGQTNPLCINVIERRFWNVRLNQSNWAMVKIIEFIQVNSKHTYSFVYHQCQWILLASIQKHKHFVSAFSLSRCLFVALNDGKSLKWIKSKVYNMYSVYLNTCSVQS